MRVSYLVILAHPVLPPLLCDEMLDHALLGLALQELANKPRVPEFAGDAQVLAAPHQRIRLASFCRCWNSIRVEILLLATCDRY